MSATLGTFIRERRQDLGLSQEQLADRIGETVRQAEVSRLENNRISLPRRERMERLAAALEVTLGEPLVRSGWMEEGDALPEREPHGDIDPAPWDLPLPGELDGMTLPELVAMLERIGEEQDQAIKDDVELEDTRKAVTTELHSQLGNTPNAGGSEVRPMIGVNDGGESGAMFPA
jgi:transcriptional regulator with XRE-family HTH domain